MKKEISQPLIVGTIVAAVILVGVFGWLRLRSSGPNVTPDQTQQARQAQLQMMPHTQQNSGQQGSR